MLRFLILRIFLPLLILWLIRGLIKGIFASMRSEVTEVPKSTHSAEAGRELKKDPVCGTYVSVDAAVTQKINGELVHFCSTACRDRYRAA